METTIDLTMTSVGRETLKVTVETFLRHASFSGSFRVLATIDPAYGVSEAALADTARYLEELPARFPSVTQVHIERLPKRVGLGQALTILFSHAVNEIGVHLEDDWEFVNDFNLDALAHAMVDQDSSELVLTNSHVARDGTFQRSSDVQPVSDALLRLTPNSWAYHYLPLCPHIHRRSVWVPYVMRALALTEAMACVDDRVRERVMFEQEAQRLNVLWTRDILADDIGRPWLRERGQFRTLVPEHLGSRQVEDFQPTNAEDGLRLTRSHEWRSKADALIPGTTQTYHKRPANFADGSYPMFLERGAGAMVWDVDGNAYVDYVCSLGASTLGHGHPVVTNTVHERVGRGVLLSLPTPAEVGAAEALAQAIPGVEMVRFLKTGAEACAAAVRLARHITGRSHILLVGYHGWHDQFASTAGKGVPRSAIDLTTRLELADVNEDEQLLESLAARGHELAAVLLSTPYHRQLSADLLRRVRTVCDASGTLLIFDEIVTGFRIAPGGLGQHCGVQPDILCLSKGIAAGMPLAAVAGPARTMQELGDLTVSTTFGGEILSLEVLKRVQQEYNDSGYYEHIADLGRALRDGINAVGAELGVPGIVVGYDPMPCLRFSSDSTRHSRISQGFLAGMAKRGVLLRRDVNFISGAHSLEQIALTVAAAGSALRELDANGVLHDGA